MRRTVLAECAAVVRVLCSFTQPGNAAIRLVGMQVMCPQFLERRGPEERCSYRGGVFRVY